MCVGSLRSGLLDLWTESLCIFQHFDIHQHGMFLQAQQLPLYVFFWLTFVLRLPVSNFQHYYFARALGLVVMTTRRPSSGAKVTRLPGPSSWHAFENACPRSRVVGTHDCLSWAKGRQSWLSVPSLGADVTRRSGRATSTTYITGCHINVLSGTNECPICSNLGWSGWRVSY